MAGEALQRRHRADNTDAEIAGAVDARPPECLYARNPSVGHNCFKARWAELAQPARRPA